jgi:nicotinamide riboside kinase
MRIAVVGPQNTGKSTFIKDFILEFKNYITPEDTYRDVVTENNLEINQKTTEFSQKKILDFLYNQITENIAEKIIFDRCVIDNYIYSLAANNLEKSFLEITKRKMLDHLKFLDMIIFIPTSVSVNLVDDSLRDTDRLFIDKINKLFLETLFYISNFSNIPIKVITGSREERILQIKNILT